MTTAQRAQIDAFLGNNKAPLREGAELLKAYGSAGAWRTYVSAKPQYKRKVLRGQLSSIAYAALRQEERPVRVKNSIGADLRTEFPNINFETLPDELKLLVLERKRLWDATKANYNAQHDAQDAEARLQASRAAVDSYERNREIWAELNHYEKTGEVLGAARDMRMSRLAKELAELSELPAVELGATVANKLRNCKSEITRQKDDPDSVERLIERYNALAQLINAEPYGIDRPTQD